MNEASSATRQRFLRSRAARIAVLAAVALALVVPPAARAGETLEVLPYRWNLGGFKGFVARFVVPGSGDAELRTKRTGNGGTIQELHITSPDSERGEFWLYGSKVRGKDCARLESAWTEHFFRGRGKEKRADISERGVLDIPSTICRIRHDAPAEPMETRIWSDGKIYPIVISAPRPGSGTLGGRQIATRTYEVAGLKRPGERVWDGKLRLIVALDERRTPIEIALVQPGLKVRLQLAEGS